MNSIDYGKITNEPTDQEKDQGYQICPCGKNVHLLQAGFECRHIKCRDCGYSVVDLNEFRMTGDAVEIMSKGLGQIEFNSGVGMQRIQKDLNSAVGALSFVKNTDAA